MLPKLSTCLCRTNRITRPLSKMVTVKTTSSEFLLLYRPSFRSRFPFSEATAAQGWTRRGRLITRDSSFSSSALRVRTWTLKALADLPRPVRLTCLPVLPQPRPSHPFHVRKPPLSLSLLHRLFLFGVWIFLCVTCISFVGRETP